MATSKYERIQQRLNGLETRETDSRLVKDTIKLIKQYTHQRLQTVASYQHEPEGTTKSKYYHDRCDVLLKLFTEIDIARRNDCDGGLVKVLKLCNEDYLSKAFPYLRLRATSTLYYAINVLREETKSDTFVLRQGKNQYGNTIDELTRTCEELTQHKEVLTRENATLRLKNEELQGQVDGLNKKVTELEAEITGHNAKISDLTDRNTKLDKQVSDLTDRNTKLEEQVTTLIESKTESDEKFSKLEAQVQILMQGRSSPSTHVGPSYESFSPSSDKCELSSGSNSQSSCSPDTHFLGATTTGSSVGCASAS